MDRTHRSHSELYYHYIWKKKDEAAIIDAEMEIGMKQIFFSKAKDLGIQIIEAEGAYDHVHVLVRSIPSPAPSDIAKHLKGASSHFVNHVTLKNDQIRSLYWQDGYAVYSVSPGAVESLRKYIRNQKEHHKKNDLREEHEL